MNVVLFNKKVNLSTVPPSVKSVIFEKAQSLYDTVEKMLNERNVKVLPLCPENMKNPEKLWKTHWMMISEIGRILAMDIKPKPSPSPVAIRNVTQRYVLTKIEEFRETHEIEQLLQKEKNGMAKVFVKFVQSGEDTFGSSRFFHGRTLLCDFLRDEALRVKDLMQRNCFFPDVVSVPSKMFRKDNLFPQPSFKKK